MELLILILLAIGGFSAWQARQRRRRQLALDAVRTPLLLPGGHAHSLADLFWELGATPLALELLIRRDLLPRDGTSPDAAHRAVQDDIAAFGSWTEYVDSMHETLAELEEEARAARLHRNLPHLALPDERMLPGASPSAPPVLIDHRRDPDVVAWLESLFTGRLDETISRWWHGRHLRNARRELDRTLANLALTVSSIIPPEDIDRRLQAMVHARNLEHERLLRLRNEHTPKSSPWSLTVAALLLSSSSRADVELQRARAQSSRLMSELRDHIRSGRHDKAGWLLYVNRRILQDLPGTSIPVALESVDRAADRIRQQAEASPP